MMTMYIIIGVLALAVVGLALKILTHEEVVRTIQLPAPPRSKYITVADVPNTLKEFFEADYGGSARLHDERLQVCFRFARIHQNYTNDDNPIDCVFSLHRVAYLTNPNVSAEFAKLLGKLEAAGLDFVAIYGKHVSRTTEPFRVQLDAGACSEHGDVEVSAEEKESIGRGGDRVSTNWREKAKRRIEANAALDQAAKTGNYQEEVIKS